MIDRFLLRVANAHSFLSKLWVLTRPYWFADERQSVSAWHFTIAVREAWIARALLVLVVFLSVLIVYMSKLINFWNARFFNAIQEKNPDAFWYELKYWTVLLAGFIIAVVYRQWLMQLLSIRWRRWLSEVYFRDWLADRTYYRMELARQGADNPEQRIEQDCNSFTTETLNIVLGLLLQIMTIVTFAGVLWELSGSFVLPIFGGMVIRGYMMWAAFGYALVGSLATYFIGRPLVRVNFDLERYNADFRYRMVRIRENSESIALYRGEPDEERSLRLAFANIYGVWWSFMKYNKRLTWLTSFYGQAASIFPILIAAPRYFSGQIALGALTQTADAFGQVQGSLSWFVDTYGTLAAWKAAVDRLTTFSETMVQAKRDAAESAFDVRPQQLGKLVLKDVELRLPNGELLLHGINLRIHQGDSVVLRGDSGSGKTTLFRVLAGLWPYGQGRVSLPKDARILFLPQKPYLPIGSLKEALTYPEASDNHTDGACREVLEACGLGHLADRLNDTANWSLALSGGEQQRVAIGRALLYRPDWLFLDEATSALDDATEQRMYELLLHRLPRATMVSIAHRPTVLSLHERQIIIDRSSHKAISDAIQAR